MAKDISGNAATVGGIVSIVDFGVTPVVLELDVSPTILHVATGFQQVRITATVMDLNLDITTVRLELLKKPVQSKRAEDEKLDNI